MTTDLPIRYRGYWDVPRIFLTRYRNRLYLFDCPFSETLDDYPDVYAVYLMPDIPDDETPNDWTTLPPRATAYLGEVPVTRVRFDPTRRKTIGAEVFDDLPLLAPSANGANGHPVAPTGATRPAG
jgi:hypothetical protein